MANPQKENGYTPISNKIMKALIKIRISGEEWQCLGFILRKTYGWGKTWDQISLSQFQEATGINKQNVCRALGRLLSKKIISIIKKDKGITEYSLQKDYDQWEPLSKKITLSKKIKGIIKKDKETPQIVIKKDTHKNNIKTTITKDNIPESENEERVEIKKEWSPQVKFLVEEYFKTLFEAQQKRFEKYRDEFHDCCDKLLRIDGFSKEEIRKAVNFARYNEFWSINFLSFSKLRKKDKDGVPYIEVFLNRAGIKNKQSDTISPEDPPPNSEIRRENWLKMIDEHLGKGLSVYKKEDLVKIKEKIDEPTYDRVLSILEEKEKEKEK